MGFNRLKFKATFLFLLFFGSLAYGSAETDAIRTFSTDSEKPVKVRMHPTLHTPYSIEGSFRYPKNMKKTDAASAFLGTHFGKVVGSFQAKNQTFSYRKTHEDKFKRKTVVRMQQRYKNIPIFNSDLSVHISTQNTVDYMSGKVYQVTANTEAKISLKKAILLAQKELQTTQKSIASELCFYDLNGVLVLVWHIQINTYSPLGQWHVFINASSGGLTSKYNNIQSERNRETYILVTPNYQLPGKLALTERQTTTNTSVQVPHNHLGTTYDYFYKNFGRDSFDNQGALIKEFLFLPEQNAYWDGEELIFGGGRVGFGNFANSLDVVAHEFGHAVTGYTAGLIYQNQSGALNESMSDVWGAMVDTENWDLGEDIYSPRIQGWAIRHMDDPGKGGQPAHMQNYVTTQSDNGGVHTNSGIPNKAAYLVATSIGRPDTEQIYYRALTTYFTSSTDFLGARLGLEKAAIDLFGLNSVQQKAVQTAFDTVGVTDPDHVADSGQAKIIPLPPYHINATGKVGDPEGSIDLTWRNPTDNFQKVMVRRQGPSSMNSIYEGTLVYSGTGTSASDLGLVNGQTYHYALYAQSASGYWSEQATASATVDSKQPVVDFTITPLEDRLSLTWSNPHHDAFDHVEMRKSTSGEIRTTTDGTLIYSGTGAQFDDTSVQKNVTYNYGIFAVSKQQTLSRISTVRAQLKVIPAAPSHLSADGEFGVLRLTWTNPTENFKQVMIRRHLTSSFGSITQGTLVYTGSGTATTDIGLSNGQTYYYAFYSQNTNGYWSTQATISARVDYTLPISHVQITPFEDKITLAWANPSIDTYDRTEIRKSLTGPLRSTSDGVLVYSGSGTRFTDTDVQKRVTYYYGTYTVSKKGNTSSLFQSTSHVILFPDPPSHVTGVGKLGKINLTWVNPTENFEQVMVRRHLTSSFGSITQGTLVYSGASTKTSDLGLTNGQVYYYALYSQNTSGYWSSQATISVTVDNIAPVSQVQITPFQDKLTLAWVNPTMNTYDHTEIRRQTTQAVRSTSDGTLVYSGTNTSFEDTSVQKNITYYYGLFAVSKQQGVASVVTSNSQIIVIPKPPSHITAIGKLGKINLTWVNPTENFQKVMIRRHLTPSFNLITQGTLVYEGSGTSTSDINLTNAQTYYYAFYSRNTNGYWSTQTTVSATVDSTEPVSQIQLTSYKTKLGLSWVNPTHTVFDHVEIRRSTSRSIRSVSDGTRIYSGTGASFDDTDVQKNSTYNYGIFAVSRQGTFSSVSTINGQIIVIPAPPSRLSAIGKLGKINLTWANTVENFKQVMIRRHLTSSFGSITDGVLVYTGTGTATSDINLTNGQTYYYAFYATNTNGYWSTQATVSATVDSIAPVREILLTPYTNKLALSWSNPTHNVFDHSVIRRSALQEIRSVSDGTQVFSGTTTVFNDTTAKKNTLYYYGIFAVSQQGTISLVSTANGQRIVVSEPPTDLSAVGKLGKIDLTWSNPSENFQTVMIRRHVSSTFNEITQGTLVYTGTDTRFSDRDLTNGQTYYYAFYARNIFGTWSDQATVSAAVDTIKLSSPKLDNGLKPTLKFNFKYSDAVTVNVTLNITIKEILGNLVISSFAQHQTRVMGSFSLHQKNPKSFELNLAENGIVLLPNHHYSVDYTLEDSTGYSTTSSLPELSTDEYSLQVQELLNGPNPFNPAQSGTSIEYTLTKPAKVSLFIYALNGTNVWKKTISESEEGGLTGLNKVSWDGTNDMGSHVANGMYILYLIASDGTTTVKKKLKIGVAKQ